MTDSTFDHASYYQPADDQSQDQYEVFPHLRDYFQEYELTASQEAAVQQLEGFFAGDTQVFLLKGYAGAGHSQIPHKSRVPSNQLRTNRQSCFCVKQKS